MLEPGAGPDPARDPAASACLARTRSAVLNVLVVAGLGIAASGWILGRHDPEAPPWGPDRTHRAGMAALLVLAAFAYMMLRVGSGRDALRDPSRRASRFFKARVGAAGVAARASPPSGSPPWASGSWPSRAGRSWTTSRSRWGKGECWAQELVR